jgi:hypothetical protein
MLTGDIEGAHLERARLIADRILPKPVGPAVLLRELTKLLD